MRDLIHAPSPPSDHSTTGVCTMEEIKRRQFLQFGVAFSGLTLAACGSTSDASAGETVSSAPPPAPAPGPPPPPPRPPRPPPRRPPHLRPRRPRRRLLARWRSR